MDDPFSNAIFYLPWLSIEDIKILKYKFILSKFEVGFY